MLNGIITIGVLAVLFSLIVFYAAVRRQLRHRIEIRRRLAQIGSQASRYKQGGFVATEIESTQTGYQFIAPPGFGFHLPPDNDTFEVTSDRFHMDWQQPSLYQSVRTSRMSEIMRAADSLEYNDLVQAAIRLGHNLPIAHAYAAEIRILEDGGDPLPAAMAHQPNVGGDDRPQYRGGNYVDEQEIAHEMKTIRHFGTDD